MNGKIVVNGAEITVTTIEDKDYISLTDTKPKTVIFLSPTG